MSAVFDDRGAGGLQARIDSLASFNRHVAHDLRGPLVSVAGAARLAQQALARGEHAMAERLMQALVGCAEDLSHLVVDLLALAEASDAPLPSQHVDLHQLAQRAIEQLSLAHQLPDQQFQLAPLPGVRGAAGLLQQVFVNLLGNAVKFTRGAAAPLIELGCARLPQGPALFVRDNGVGFDAQQADSLFEPFTRLHGQQFPGHGIGLSLVKRVVERHGGRVWAAPRWPDCGAVFYFTLAGLSLAD